MLVDPGRVELEHLHVLHRDPTPVADGRAVAGQRVGVRGDLEHLPVAAGGEEDRPGVEDVQLSGRQLVGHDAGGPFIPITDQVEHVELVEEPDVALDALLVERLQDHVAGAIGGIARAHHRRLAVVARVAAEAPLVDPPVGHAVERQSPALQLDDHVDGLAAHQLGRRLVHQVVAALHRVEGVPLGEVLLDVPERGTHAALRGPRVRAGGIQLGDDGRPDLRGGFDRRAHPGAAGAHDHGVVLMERGHPVSSDRRPVSTSRRATSSSRTSRPRPFPARTGRTRRRRRTCWSPP